MGINFLLLKNSFKTGWKRMVLIASSVAVGVLILFSFTAFFNAVTDMDNVAWMNNLSMHDSIGHKPVDGVDPVYVAMMGGDELNGRFVQIIDMQKSGDNSPEIAPGLQAPDPGEFYASPALADYIAEHPDEHLEYRYGKLAGELPESVVPARDDFYVVRGSNYPIRDGQIYLWANEDDETAEIGTPVNDLAVYDFVDYEVDNYFDSAEYNISKAVVYAGIIILLFPVIMLVSIATRLGGVQREQRYASLRLIGVTNGQVTSIIATESFISTLIGIVAGWLLYLLVRPLLFDFTLSESRFWPSAITVTTVQSLVITGLTLVMSLFANWWGMRHVRTSPLGISQKQKMEKRPGWWRVLPLLVSLAVLIFMTVHKPANNNETLTMINAFLLLIVAMMFSLVIVTPWLTYHLAQLVSRFTKRPTILIGTKYVRAHARAIARSVSGVVLALFAGSFYILGTSGVAALEKNSVANNGYSILRDNTAIVQGLSDSQSNQLEQKLANHDPDFATISNATSLEQVSDYVTGKCLALNNYVDGLDCGQGELVAIDFYLASDDARQIIYADTDDELYSKIRTNVKQIHLAVDPELDEADIDEIMDRHRNVYISNVADADTEKFRSAIAKLTGDVQPTGSVEVTSAAEAKTPSINPAIESLASLAYGGMAVTMAVAIVSIVVSTIGGLLERRHSMYMLRFSGIQVSELKRMVIIESLVPLIVMSLVSASIGAWAGSTFTQIGSSTLKPTITPMYIAVVIGSLVIAAIAIYLILPMINCLTSPEANQTE